MLMIESLRPRWQPEASSAHVPTLDARLWSAAASNATQLLLSAPALSAFYAPQAGLPLFGAVLTDRSGR
jgi:hypothetical protein